ncbi:hypothetical protein [Methylobacterium sp. CM6257]
MPSASLPRLNAFLKTAGPGLLVMLADTDIGSLIAAAFVALDVVALALAWGFGDVTGKPHSLEQSPLEAPAFYGAFTPVVVAGRSPCSSCRTSWPATSPWR